MRVLNRYASCLMESNTGLTITNVNTNGQPNKLPSYWRIWKQSSSIASGKSMSVLTLNAILTIFLAPSLSAIATAKSSFKNCSGLPFCSYSTFKKGDLDARQELYRLICEEIWIPARFDRELV